MKDMRVLRIVSKHPDKMVFHSDIDEDSEIWFEIRAEMNHRRKSCGVYGFWPYIIYVNPKTWVYYCKDRHYRTQPIITEFDQPIRKAIDTFCGALNGR